MCGSCVVRARTAAGAQWNKGDGTGGSETYLGTTTGAKDCEKMVRDKKSTANGATWGHSNGRCYAEFGMTGAIWTRARVLARMQVAII